MKKGFTIVEILVVTLIMSFIVAGIFGVLNIGNVTWSTDMGLLELQQQARLAMNGIVSEIRQASPNDISIPASSRIEFRIPTDITTVPVTFSQEIVYYLDNDRIIREHPAGDTKVLAQNISNLAFCCVNGSNCTSDCSSSKILRVQIKSSKVSGTRLVEFPPIAGTFLTTEVKLRNES